MASDQLSPHFRRAEFACPCCGKVVVAQELVAALERLRARAYPGGLRILSGYRCPRHNAAVGGVGGSQHLRGTAADIPGRIGRQLAAAAGFRGIGTMRSSGLVVHVDVRAVPARWEY